jgi:hypothetical protein
VPSDFRYALFTAIPPVAKTLEVAASRLMSKDPKKAKWFFILVCILYLAADILKYSNAGLSATI